MSTFVGLLFLVGGGAAFLVSLLFLVLRDQWGTRTPKRTVAHFERSRSAMSKIHHVQTRLRDSSRARARALHPSGGGAAATHREGTDDGMPTRREPGHRRTA